MSQCVTYSAAFRIYRVIDFICTGFLNWSHLSRNTKGHYSTFLFLVTSLERAVVKMPNAQLLLHAFSVASA